MDQANAEEKPEGKTKTSELSAQSNIEGDGVADLVEKEYKYTRLEDAAKSSIAVTCIGPDYEEKDIEAYRWTFEDIKDSRNFEPRAIALDRNHPTWPKTAASCGGWSLSFFVSEQSALSKLMSLCKDKPNLHLKLGTHIAKGMIEESDGKSGDFSSSGHFEHFEYEGTDFSEKFVVIRKVAQ